MMVRESGLLFGPPCTMMSPSDFSVHENFRREIHS